MITIEAIRAVVREEVQAALQTSDRPLTSEQAAIFLVVSRSTLWAWSRDWVVKARKVGGRVYYRRNELIDAMRAA